MDPRCLGGWRSIGFLGKDRKKYGPQDPLVVQEGGREGDSFPNLISELPCISNGEFVGARSQAGLVRRRKNGSF